MLSSVLWTWFVCIWELKLSDQISYKGILGICASRRLSCKGSSLELFWLGKSHLRKNYEYLILSKLLTTTWLFIQSMDDHELWYVQLYLLISISRKIVSSSLFTPSQDHRPSTVSLHSLLSNASLSSWYQILPQPVVVIFIFFSPRYKQTLMSSCCCCCRCFWPQWTSVFATRNF